MPLNRYYALIWPASTRYGKEVALTNRRFFLEGKSIGRKSAMNRAALVCTILALAGPLARGDDTWHNVYHSLKRYFTGSDNHRHSASTSSGGRHRKPKRPAQAKAQGSPPPAGSPIPQTAATPAPAPVEAGPAPPPRQVEPSLEPERLDANPTPAPREIAK